ncbi:MAG: hypothetical protein O3A68_08040 [Proteobacteria bacterium]|nr:hypothetical protein [Pseudomonadota bacterium]
MICAKQRIPVHSATDPSLNRLTCEHANARTEIERRSVRLMIVLFGLIDELEFRRRLMIVFELDVEMGDDLMRKMSSNVLAKDRQRKSDLRNNTNANQKPCRAKGTFFHSVGVWSVDTNLKASSVKLPINALFKK